MCNRRNFSRPQSVLRLLLVGLWLWALPGVSLADDMKESVEEAAQILATGKLTHHTDRSIIIEVVNLHSKKRDQTAKAIETQLYQALGKEFKDFKLLFLEDSLAGINLNKAIFIHGTYEPKGKDVTAIFSAVIGMKGEAVGQAQVTFDAPNTVGEALVAVLDIEAADLATNQRRAYSDMFRSRLQKSGKIKLASSAEVAKMSPDAIQESYKCTRDECATIIGEQLGVDRVVSTSLIKLGPTQYMLTAKIMDIKNGSILSSETLQHEGGLGKLPGSINKLADMLVGVDQSAPSAKRAPVVVSSESSSGASWLWHVSASTLFAGALASSSTAAKQYDTLATENTGLKTTYSESLTQTELTATEKKFADNTAKMKTLKAQVTQMNSIAAVAGLWETYLLFFGGESEVALNEQPGMHFAVTPNRSADQTAALSLSYVW